MSSLKEVNAPCPSVAAHYVRMGGSLQLVTVRTNDETGK